MASKRDIYRQYQFTKHDYEFSQGRLDLLDGEDWREKLTNMEDHLYEELVRLHHLHEGRPWPRVSSSS